jgi:hypothetical protein
MVAFVRPSALTLFLCLSAPAALAAQDAASGSPAPGVEASGRGRVSGKVVAAETGQPIPGAAVVVHRAGDSTVVSRSVTGADGAFRVTGLAPGRYDVRIRHLGYSPHTVTGLSIAAGAPAVELGVIRLATAPIALEGLEVEADRGPAVLAADRTIYSTKDMPASAGGKAIDVLRNVPELEVDIEGKVSLHGLQSVAIHINGRPAPMRGEALQNSLQQFPADRIERIEVIPNPSAKFDAEGMAGIVNIVLKDDVDLGLSGSLSANTGTRGSGGSARLAYQRGPLTFFGGGSFNVQNSDNRVSDRR